MMWMARTCSESPPQSQPTCRATAVGSSDGTVDQMGENRVPAHRVTVPNSQPYCSPSLVSGNERAKCSCPLEAVQISRKLAQAEPIPQRGSGRAPGDIWERAGSCGRTSANKRVAWAERCAHNARQSHNTDHELTFPPTTRLSLSRTLTLTISTSIPVLPSPRFPPLANQPLPHSL